MDRRFESRRPSAEVQVPGKRADAWLKYLAVACGSRGWGFSTLGQMASAENSGSITIYAGDAGEISVVWERRKGGPMRVRASSPTAPGVPDTDIAALIEEVQDLSRRAPTQRFRQAGLLYYDDLPWRGEIWLDEGIRLCPPSRQYEDAVLGPRVILVDAQVDGIDGMDAAEAFRVRMREVSVFLSVVMGTAVRITSGQSQLAWTWTLVLDGHVEAPAVRQIGYVETAWPEEQTFPQADRPVPLVQVHRPGPALNFFDGSQTEQRLPADVIELWHAFQSLPADQRKQFLGVGSIWQLAMSLAEYPTSSYALKVVACEALKPRSPSHRDRNIYDVTEVLLGKDAADSVRRYLKPQDVRNAHLHAAEFVGDEFARDLMISSFRDPTFMLNRRAMTEIAQAAIIEWVRRGGVTVMPDRAKRRRSLRAWVRRRALYLLPAALALGVFLGAAIR